MTTLDYREAVPATRIVASRTSVAIAATAVCAVCVLLWPYQATISATGAIKMGTGEVVCVADHGGRIAAIRVRAGDSVAKGSLLVEYDAAQEAERAEQLDRLVAEGNEQVRRLEARCERAAQKERLAADRLALAERAAELAIADRARDLRRSSDDVALRVEKSEADVAYFRTRVERGEKLLGAGVVAQATLDDDRHRLRQAVLELEDARRDEALLAAPRDDFRARQNAELASLRAMVLDTHGEVLALESEMAEERSDTASRSEERRGLELALARSKVLAPVSGIVTRLGSFAEGTPVAQGSELFTIVEDAGSVYVDVVANGEYFGRIREGQFLYCSVDGLSSDESYRFDARIERVWADRPDSEEPGTTSASRTVARARAAVWRPETEEAGGPPGWLRYGQDVSVRILTGRTNLLFEIVRALRS